MDCGLLGALHSVLGERGFAAKAVDVATVPFSQPAAGILSNR
jgi:hypothetical protein